MSIQVSLNGLSFSIYDTASKSISYVDDIAFEKKLNPFETLERLKSELSSSTKFSEDFEGVTVIHYNELATLVPDSLYVEANNAEYLKYNSKILRTDFIASDKLKFQDIVSVYVPYVNINNYIYDTFGTFKYKHASTLFIDSVSSINKTTSEAQVFINIDALTMQLTVFKNNELQLYNFFEFKTPEDFIYYILFTCEQEELDPELVKLILTGNINKKDDYFAICYKYIRHVEILENSNNFLIKHCF